MNTIEPPQSSSSKPGQSGERRLQTAPMVRVAVIGAGMSGLACARVLAEHGLEVLVLDKARGPGGRMSTRRQDSHTWDHGAQYFTARDTRFRRYVDIWLQQGLVAPWNGRTGRLHDGQLTMESPPTDRFVGTPTMSAITRHLAADIRLETSCRITAVQPESGGWRLIAEDGRDLGRFDRVVISTPAAQAVPLLAAVPALAERAAAAVLDPCWAVMASFDPPISLPCDAARVDANPLAWIARDSSKPSRPNGDRWVLHASPVWSRQHLEETPEHVLGALLQAFSRATGSAHTPVQAMAHRWRYALASQALGQDYLYDDRGLGACGDWCLGPRVEAAFLSGVAMAGRILDES